jgi:hypothetical protein
VKRVTGTEQIVATSFAGMLADIAWIGHYDSIGQYDMFRSKVITDSQYVAALKIYVTVPGNAFSQWTAAPCSTGSPGAMFPP